MRLFFDENLPHTIAKALNILQKTDPSNDGEVTFLPDVYGFGAKDEEWIPKVAQNDTATIITCDHQIDRRADQKALYQQHGLGLVVLKPPSKSGLKYWEQVRKIIKHWHEILEIEKNTPKPYLFLIKMRSTSLEYDGKNLRDK